MFVDALEREDWSRIGEPVYVRGFLKNYARMMDVDCAPALAALSAPQPPRINLRHDSAPNHSMSWFPYAFWSLMAVAAVMVSLVVVEAFGPSARRIGAPQPTQLQQPPTVSQVRETFATAANAPTLASNAGKDGVNLHLHLTDASWLSVRVDGKQVVYGILPAGAERDFHGDRRIDLRAGNAGGVQAQVDGRDLGTLGKAGEVSDQTFLQRAQAHSAGPRG